MVSSLVTVVGMTVTLLFVLVKFHASATVLGSTAELRVTEQTKSFGCAITPCGNAFEFKNICGVGTRELQISKVMCYVIT